MSFAQATLVGTQNQRDVRKLRDRGTERLVQKDLLGSIRYVISATNDVGDLHIDVVNHNSQVIGGHAIRTKQYKIFDRCEVVLDASKHMICKFDLSLRWNLEAKNVGLTLAFLVLDVGNRQAAAGAVILPGQLRTGCRLTFFRE